MGYGWRRVTETVRQRLGSDKSFKATTNARNEAMFKEATDFCAHLRLLERDLRSTHKDVEGKAPRSAPRCHLAPSGTRSERSCHSGATSCSPSHLLPWLVPVGKFTNLRTILQSPLPRQYEEGANGAAPLAEEPKLVGQGVPVDELTRAANELRQRLDDEVLKPLRSWLEAYRSVAVRLVGSAAAWLLPAV
jgi:hypothetical protein